VSKPLTDASSLDPTRTWVIDGGPQIPSLPAEAAPSLVIAADVGYQHAVALGLSVDVVVGDFDSLAPDNLQENDPGVLVQRHPQDKDASDLALALQFAWTAGATSVDILTGGEGRLDHLLVGLMLIANEENIGHRIVTHCGPSRAVALQPGKPFDLEVTAGSWLTLLALDSDSSASTKGLRWNLAATDKVSPFSSLGLSNEVVQSPEITVHRGVLLVVVTSRNG
jgi:thiamine pyrophosphokinase